MAFSQLPFSLKMWKEHQKSLTRKKKTMPGFVLSDEPSWTSEKEEKRFKQWETQIFVT